MKFTTKLPPLDLKLQDYLSQNGWIQLKEPKNLSIAFIQSIPFMLIGAACSFIIIQFFAPFSWSDLGFDVENGALEFNLLAVVWLILLLFVHEALHLILVPKFLTSKNTFFGITLFGGFIHTTELIPKSRFLWITIFPFLLLSIIAPIVLGIFGLLTSTMKVLIIFNALGSSIDLLSFMLICRQVPNNTYLRNNGMKTYWKLKEENADEI